MPVAYRDARKPLRAGLPRPVRARGGTLVLRNRAILGGLAAVILGMSAGSPHVVAAFGSTRTISFFHIHTKETLTITYKKDGQVRPRSSQEDRLADARLASQQSRSRWTPRPSICCGRCTPSSAARSRSTSSAATARKRQTKCCARRVGGQAKKSKHMTGQAIDAAFPDIPLKQLRWSAAIREVGGIGYYPTSGIPFVHVDTGPVRAWPRLPRSELALLFPDGRTKHHPADGGELTRDDVRRARANTDVAKQVAAYFDLRTRPKSPVEIAQAEAGIAPPAPTLRSPPTQVARPAPEARIAAFETEVFEATPIEAPVPKLVQAPRLATPPPSDAERGRLNQLVTLASLSPTDVPAQRLQTADADRYLLDQLVDTASVEAPGPAPRSQGAAIVLTRRNAGRLARPRSRARSARPRSDGECACGRLGTGAGVRRRPSRRAVVPPVPDRSAADPVGIGRRRGAGQDRASQPRAHA